MSLVSKFTAQANTPVQVRLTKPVQQLTLRRTAIVALALATAGLDDAFPERIAAEITHPSRKRVDGGSDLPLGLLAMWGQYLTGPITETVIGSGDQARVTTEVTYFLNQSSPIDLTSEDQFFVKFEGLITGADYEVYAPEQPVLYPAATCFYNYEMERILASDREKSLSTADCCGLIIPNSPDKIKEVRMTYLVDGRLVENVYPLRELLIQAQRKNPFVGVLNSATGATRFSFTSDAAYILLALNFVPQVEIHTALGQEVDYMLVKVLDRNNL
jgi:hypothetical protein